MQAIDFCNLQATDFCVCSVPVHLIFIKKSCIAISGQGTEMEFFCHELLLLVTKNLINAYMYRYYEKDIFNDFYALCVFFLNAL